MVLKFFLYDLLTNVLKVPVNQTKKKNLLLLLNLNKRLEKILK